MCEIVLDYKPPTLDGWHFEFELLIETAQFDILMNENGSLWQDTKILIELGGFWMSLLQNWK